jgi:general stress protein YciG
MAEDNGNNSNSGGRGFASMSEEERRRIASKGGKAAHESGNAHEFDSDSGREAGRKGGQARSNSSGSENENM